MSQRSQLYPEIDVSEFVNHFNQNPHQYGYAYRTPITDEVYRQYTYSSIWTYTAPNLAFRDRTIETRNFDATRQRNANRRTGPVQTISPYDFHGKVQADDRWSSVCTIEAAQIKDASLREGISEEDILFVGSAKVFDKKLIHLRSKVPLPQTDTYDGCDNVKIQDPVFEDVCKTKSKYQLRVITTVKILAALSVCSRSVCPFELVFKKSGSDLFVFAREPKSPAVMESFLETISIPVTSRHEDADLEFDSGLDAVSNITKQFISYVQNVGGDAYPLSDDQGSLKADPMKAYVYRRLILKNIEIVYRCEVDCLRDPVEKGNRPSVSICRTLSNFPTDLRQANWLSSLEKQRSSFLVGEIKDNGNMFSRWVAIGRLMKASQIFIGFVQCNKSVQESTRNSSAPSGSLLAVERQVYERGYSIASITEGSLMGCLYLIFSRLFGQSDGRYHFQFESKKKTGYIFKE